ncbi:MAG: hypothetical protein Q4E31_01290 [Intestinibacter bartlettii]|uniref:hypothetical protein n=1 Tax=Intestinibacter bartlettii TaxID=261299 RepID=UPI0026E9A7DE|nr:hypothetical protein [Intestinibacter bartlettii]MDO5009432.1 hypothetical protein [Intestinibacter bartlettii]
MEFIQLSDEQLKEHFNNANSWFVGLYMESFLNNFDKLSNEDFKLEFASDLKSSEPYLINNSIDEIKEMVNSLYKIISAKKVLEALNMVILFESDEEPNCYAYEEAKYLRELIKKGRIKLPY